MSEMMPEEYRYPNGSFWIEQRGLLVSMDAEARARAARNFRNPNFIEGLQPFIPTHMLELIEEIDTQLLELAFGASAKREARSVLQRVARG